MKLLTVDEIREKLKDRRLNIVAEKTAIHYNTVVKMARGEIQSPSYKTLVEFTKYFTEKESAIDL
jgi:hypothetical protein